MKKIKFKIEKIFKNKVNTKYGEKDKFTLVSGNYGFNGWGTGEDYQENQVVELEYDEKSKFQGKDKLYFSIIQPKKNDKLEERINDLEKRVEALESAQPKKDNPLILEGDTTGQIGQRAKERSIIADQPTPISDPSEEISEEGIRTINPPEDELEIDVSELPI